MTDQGGGDGECLENCQGSIMGVERLASVTNEEGLEIYISDYENYKEQQLANPVRMKGKSNRIVNKLTLFII